MKAKKEITKRKTQQQTKILLSRVTQNGKYAANKKEGTENIERTWRFMWLQRESFPPTETVVTREEVSNRKEYVVLPEAINTVTCEICRVTPCRWRQVGPAVQSLLLLEYPKESMALDDYHLALKRGNKLFTFEKHGILGENRRIKVPNCVLQEIRNIYPDAHGIYMSYLSDQNTHYVPSPPQTISSVRIAAARKKHLGQGEQQCKTHEKWSFCTRFRS